MNIFTSIPVTQLVATISHLRSKLLLLPVPSLVDIIFVFLYGFSASFFQREIQEVSSTLFSLIGARAQQISELLLTNNNLLDVLHQQPGFSVHYGIIVRLIFLSGIVTFFLYVLTQSFAWKYSLDLAEKKNVRTFFSSFFLLSGVWYVLFFILQLSMQAYLFFFRISNKGSGDTPSAALFYFFFGILFYFAFLSYTLLSDGSIFSTLKKTVFVGITKAHIILPTYLLIGSFFLSLDFFLTALSSVHQRASIVAGLLLLFPLMSVSRIYLNNVVAQVLHAEKNAHKAS